MAMRVTRFHDPAAFGRHVLPFLARNEAENCFFIGFIPQLLPDHLYLAVEDAAGEVVAVAIKTPGRHMALTPAPPAAVEALVDHLIANGVDPLGVQSRPETARRFAERYRSATGRAAKLKVSMAIHQLDRVTPIAGVPGSFRQATADDAELLARWVKAFVIDCHLPPVADELPRARQRIARGETFLWCVDGTPVSTASENGPTPNGMRVSLVYTPPEHRNRGYASACVAALSQRMLDAGRKFCFLYTDLANPTSNKIYHSIGYRRVADSEQYLFEPPPAAAVHGAH
jgi:predicted GNAT family acetyltransferase